MYAHCWNVVDIRFLLRNGYEDTCYAKRKTCSTYHHGRHGFCSATELEFEITVFIPYRFEIENGTSKPFAEKYQGSTVGESRISRVIVQRLG